MRVFNTTDIAKGTGVKVIGIGEYRILPGESAEIPDEIAYVRNGGKNVVAPSIVALARTNQIRFEEGTKAAPAPVQPADNGGDEDADNGEDQAPAAPELTDEEKKALAAKKRADARAAKKAAEEAAKAAAAGSAE